MADIELVIKIPDEEYKKISNSNPSYADDFSIYYAIKNGTPLPKGHGRLGDLGKIYVKLNEAQIEGTPEYKGLGEAKQIVCNAKTIIEADKGVDNG